MAYTVLVYAMMLYAMMAYAVMSLIQIEPIWRQRFEGEDPEALSFFSSLCAAPVDLLDPPHLQVLQCGLVGKSRLQLVS